MQGESSRNRRRSGSASARTVPAVAVLGLLAAVAPSCTNDFSDFDVSGGVVSGAGAASSGGTGAGGAAGDASVSASGADGGLTDTGGTSGGGTGGGSGAGGVSGGTGGTSATGGTATATGGSSSGGTAGAGGGATGGVTATGGSVGTGGQSDAGTTCAGIFGSVPGYLLCAEDATTCSFVHASSTTEMCQMLCPRYGGACVSASNCDAGSCTVTGTATCQSQFTSAICVCAKN